ncbi:hypothetical protein FQN52_009601 [Onygenales sp. PD_12]|nr:hypothetical protein FQN52_009601 [Onygenales sp. PD_12]
MFKSALECQQYLESEDPAVIADQIRQDIERCKSHGVPSILAWYMPAATSHLGDAISVHLFADDGLEDGQFRKVRQMRYGSVMKSIQAYLSQMDHGPSSLDDGNELKLSTIPTTCEFKTALKVLDYLHAHELMTQLSASSPLSDVIAAVQTQLSVDPGLRSAFKPTPPENSGRGSRERRRKCYICRFVISDVHRLYPALCRPCGNFNLAGAEASLPENLSLVGFTALVTGGRINLGYHTVLRLLRCGARVIASTRYPRDAETKYQKEPDFDNWADRLKVVGADFRSAKDAFRLVGVVQKVLSQWKETCSADNFNGLNLLINNAAQTLTDPLKSESLAVNKEESLQTKPGHGKLLVDNDRGYEARVRGGMGLSWTARLEGHKQFLLEDIPDGDSQTSAQATDPPRKGLRGDIPQEEDNGKSSWTQSLHEIPYEDMISAHSVNAFVPLILCRELLPLMVESRASIRSPADTAPTTPRHSAPAPRGYIINVSSREGIFEEATKHGHKMGSHVHTNMSKAAINMITETEAAPTWTKHHIAMNTVDPGYMSAAPEKQRAEGCPIGFEDGAARVLWPIAVGINDGMAIWGRFLKHFGEVEVRMGLGRGTS